jgi:hypothetical protein
LACCRHQGNFPCKSPNHRYSPLAIPKSFTSYLGAERGLDEF